MDRARYGYNLAELPLAHCVGTGVILDMTWMYDEFEEKFNAAGGDPAKMGNIWHIITPEDVERGPARKMAWKSAPTIGWSWIPASTAIGG